MERPTAEQREDFERCISSKIKHGRTRANSIKIMHYAAAEPLHWIFWKLLALFNNRTSPNSSSVPQLLDQKFAELLEIKVLSKIYGRNEFVSIRRRPMDAL